MLPMSCDSALFLLTAAYQADCPKKRHMYPRGSPLPLSRSWTHPGGCGRGFDGGGGSIWKRSVYRRRGELDYFIRSGNVSDMAKLKYNFRIDGNVIDNVGNFG